MVNQQHLLRIRMESYY